jgi:hypothetical protein
MASFLTLTNSNSSVSKKFRVIFGGYANILDKAQQIDHTIDGKLDVSVGSIHERYMVTIRTRELELVTDYGSEADLKYFYKLNSPNGVPSNHITLTDHFGKTKTVIMAGDYNSQVQGIMIIGSDSWYLAGCIFYVIEDTEGGLYG